MCVIVIVISHLLWANANGEAPTQMGEIHLTLEQTQQGGCDKKETGQKIKMIVGIDGKKSGTCDGCRYRAIATSDRDSLPLLSTNRSISWYTTNYQLSIGQNPNNYPSSSPSSSSNLCSTWLSYLESNIQEHISAQQGRSREINEGKLASGGLRPWIKAPCVLLGSTHSHILSSFLGTLGLE